MFTQSLNHYLNNLETHDFFCRLTPNELDLIKKQAIIHHYTKGQIIFFQSDRRTHSFFILQGLVRLEKVDYSGEHQYLDYVKAESFFPYGGLIDATEYTHTARAATDIDLLLIPTDLITKIISENNRQLQYMYQKLARNLQYQEWRIQQIINSSAYERIIQALGLWMYDMGQRLDNEMVINYPLTINELATTAGTTRETAGKVIRDLTEERRIVFSRRQIRYLTPDFFRYYD